MKHIGIIGSRKRNSKHDYDCCVRRFLEVYEEGDIIVSGGCPIGGDHFAELIAREYEIPIILFPADWDKYGKGAGFKRNTQIAEKSDIVIAIATRNRDLCKGTMDTVNKSINLGKTAIIDDNEEPFNPENICD